MFCYITCYVMLYHVTLCYITCVLSHVILCQVIQHVLPCYIRFYVMLHKILCYNNNNNNNNNIYRGSPMLYNMTKHVI